MKILMTGFKPFNNEKLNPAEEILKLYHNDEYEIDKLKLDVLYDTDAKLVKSMLKNNYDLVILLGQAGGRAKIALEYFALNMKDCNIPDNNNVYYYHTPINPKGKICYKTNINLEKVINDIKSDDIMISYHAGCFICNDLFYNSLEYIYENDLNTKCVFIHFPFIKEQIENKPNMPYMELNDILSLLGKIIDSILK